MYSKKMELIPFIIVMILIALILHLMLISLRIFLDLDNYFLADQLVNLKAHKFQLLSVVARKSVSLQKYLLTSWGLLMNWMSLLSIERMVTHHFCWLIAIKLASIHHSWSTLLIICSFGGKCQFKCHMELCCDRLETPTSRMVDSILPLWIQMKRSLIRNPEILFQVGMTNYKYNDQYCLAAFICWYIWEHGGYLCKKSISSNKELSFGFWSM